jgi:hypothetical protein
MQRHRNAYRAFMRYAPNAPRTRGVSVLADFIVIVLGTGAILIMAAYAMLCERI